MLPYELRHFRVTEGNILKFFFKFPGIECVAPAVDTVMVKKINAGISQDQSDQGDVKCEKICLTPEMPCHTKCSNPDNVGEALVITGASMVDVSSGVELANEKDEYLVRRFIQSAKAPRPEPKAIAS